jgi:hypothetical protein
MDIHPGLPLRQGDVLISADQVSDSWLKILIVLTADCDLAREKHGGALSCIPVLTQDDYLIRFRYEKLRKSLQEKLADQLLEVYNLNSTAEPRAQLSHSRMSNWTIESEPKDVAATIGLNGKSSELFISLANAARELAACTPESISQAIGAATAAKLLLGEGKTEEKARSAVTGDFSSFLRSLPGDAIYINELSPEHAGGYVAYLRRVVEVNDVAVVMTKSRIPFETKYLRISRLRSPYVYALSQQFSAVFSAIGLPTEYETARDRNLDRLKSGAH